MAQTETEIVQGIGSDYAIKYGFHVPEDYFFKSGRGLSHELVDAISQHKSEPEWMTEFRLKAYEHYLARPMPNWGADLSEIDFDTEKLVKFLVDDRRANPSGYAIMTISEGAKPIGGDMHLSGEEDAYGHKKLGGVGDYVAHEIEHRSGIRTVYQQLAYLMRSGAPDALDLMVSTSYGYLATDLLLKKQTGRMVALRDGKYTTVSASSITEGKKRVDVNELYDIDQYRPKVAHLLGKPMFLY